MRYLPTIQVGHQIRQVAFPDIHAISLAEIYLKSPGGEQDAAARELLLQSPMLLFWVTRKWLGQNSNSPESLLDHEFEQEILRTLYAQNPVLVGDHSNQLSSVERVEPERFGNLFTFFSLRAEAVDFSAQVLSRMLVFDLLFEDRAEAGFPYASCLARMQIPLDLEALLRDFRSTDFSQFQDRQQVFARWQLDLPFFRSGLDALESKITRLASLEENFAAELEKEKIAAMRQLAYGASHEVNNPLANISTRAQALLRDETDPKRRQRLQTIDAQAFRAHDMISNLMTFARPPRPVFERLQLAPVVEQTISKLKPMADQQGVKISNDVHAAVYFMADPGQVGEILEAVVQNGIEAIRRDGSLRIVSTPGELANQVRVDVLDDGPGISSEVRKHIFDPFFSGREAGRGLGFGLSKVWRLMELHNGKVDIVNQQGWTCVQLWFPTEQPTMEIEKTA